MSVFFVPQQSIVHSTISIAGELLTHLRDSLRVTIGETVWFGNGEGTRYRTEIVDVSDRAIAARIVETIHKPSRSSPCLILGQSLLKGERMDWVIQKSTELGVGQLVPITSRHSVVQLKNDRVDHQLARWHRIAMEAAQQSEQWRVPTIASPQSLASLLTSLRSETVTILLAERRDGKSLQVVDLPKDQVGSVLVLVGPEGGWSQEEVEAANRSEAVSCTMGQHILRAETAAIAAISILQSRLGQLG